MRVNPLYQFNLVSALDNTTAEQQALTEELSSGVRLNALSDDPGSAGENVRLNQQINSDVTFSATASSAGSRLQVSDSALGSVVTQLTTAISLATEANNGTLSASNIQSIAQQLTGIRDEVLATANSTYLGQYVFAGSQGATQPFTLDSTTVPATVTYNGDSATESLTTPDGQSIQLNLPGSVLFNAPGNDVLGTLNQLIADFSSGTPAATAQADTLQLGSVLNYVGQQRVNIDNSITRLQSSASFAQSESTQLQSEQTNLIQADAAQVATQLSLTETQQTAISSVLAGLSNKSLFDYLS